MKELFLQFLTDSSASDMFITGGAGRGKTTSLAELVTLCQQSRIRIQVCAYTHKACGILRQKLPEGTPIETLHKYLKKRPTVNTDANAVKRIDGNAQFSTPEVVELLFIDEFSVVGERDLMSIREVQDLVINAEEVEQDDTVPEEHMKVIWIGDLNQLPPVKDQQTIVPQGKYWIKLTENKRLKDSNSPLHQTLDTIVSYIEGFQKPAALEANSALIRGVTNLTDAYKESKLDKVMLAYTNAQVQELNKIIQGYEQPNNGDTLFSSSLHDSFKLIKRLESYEVRTVNKYRGETLTLGSKYRTLEFMLDNDMCEFYLVADEVGEQFVYPVIFGTNEHKLAKEQAAHFATQYNKQIEEEIKPPNITQWAQVNRNHPLARKRNMAWRYYMTLNESVMCFDFDHAMTVHKSQGSTFEHVFLDTENLGICADFDFKLYLKLMYVGISRASKLVTTN